MKDKKIFLALLLIPTMVACGELSTTPSTTNPTTESPTTITPTTEVPTTSAPVVVDPLEELYYRVVTCIENDNYSMKYTLNNVEVIRKYLPNAYFNETENVGYAENETGIFNFMVFQKHVIAEEDYRRDEEGNPLKGLYSVIVTTVTSEREFTGCLVNSLENVNYSKIPSLKKVDGEDLYRISYSYIKHLLPNSPDTDMYESQGNVSCKIGLTDKGFKIIYTNKYALDQTLTLEVFDIGETKIEQITGYLNENKGPGDSGKLEDYSIIEKLKNLLNKGNYKITASNGEVRYITSNYVVYERPIEDEVYTYGYVNIPEGNNLELTKGGYQFEISDNEITLVDTESFVSSIYSTSIPLSTSILSRYEQHEDGTVESSANADLYSVSKYYSEAIVEDGSYVTKSTISVTYQDELPVVTITCDIYNDTTLQSSSLTLVIDSFGSTTYEKLDNYLLTLI